MAAMIELSPESQAQLDASYASIAEFFGSFDRMKSELADLRAEVSSLKNRIPLIECEHAID